VSTEASPVLLPYPSDPAVLASWCAREWSVWLDSGGSGRYDILGWDPEWQLTAAGGLTRARHRSGRGVDHKGDPLALLRELLGPRQAALAGLPLSSGAVGYFGYDLGRRLMGLPPASPPGPLPEMAVGIYRRLLILDHEQRQSWAVGAGWTQTELAELMRALAQPAATTATGVDCQALEAEALAIITREEYAAKFARIQRYLRDGDCYQINYTHPFIAEFSGDAWRVYLRLRQLARAPYGGWLNYPFGQVLSASPERFLSLRAETVVSEPIKGTRPRGLDADQDAALRRELAASGKDRAENLMIVDLLRNDLGKVCEAGSVQVPELFRVESFATVHHLISRIEGRLAPGRDALDLLAASFPGGSITGAPKRRAMEIIDGLEAGPRGVYCGAIGWLGSNGDMELNIAIRTTTVVGQHAVYWAGGGITADSEVDAEYQESLDKAALFARLMSEFHARPGG